LRERRGGAPFSRVAITSGRPPLGMAMLFDPLNLHTPIAGFNCGLFVKRDLTILEQKRVPAYVARQAIELIRQHGLDAWLYAGSIICDGEWSGNMKAPDGKVIPVKGLWGVTGEIQGGKFMHVMDVYTMTPPNQ
jgi:hypothetical protein